MDLLCNLGQLTSPLWASVCWDSVAPQYGQSEGSLPSAWLLRFFSEYLLKRRAGQGLV